MTMLFCIAESEIKVIHTYIHCAAILLTGSGYCVTFIYLKISSNELEISSNTSYLEISPNELEISSNELKISTIQL